MLLGGGSALGTPTSCARIRRRLAICKHCTGLACVYDYIPPTVRFFVQGSWTPAPDNATDENGVVGDVCPEGYYCTAGSVAPRPCLSGTYTPSVGNTNITACLPCEPGFMCPDSGTTTPVETCPAGFYCPAGAVYWGWVGEHVVQARVEASWQVGSRSLF